MKNLKGRRAAVLGSGLAGLAAAISLAVRGARVVVIEEKSVIAGGLRPIPVPPYFFQPWPPYFLTPAILAELFASADQRLTDFLNLHKPDPICRIVLPGGGMIDLRSDGADLARQISAISPRDGRRVRSFLARSKRIGQLPGHLQAGSSAGVGLRTLLASVLSAPSLVVSRSGGSYAGRSFRHPAVRALFQSGGLLSGTRLHGNPPAATALWAALVEEGVWAIDGGTDALRTALLRLCRENGVRFIRKGKVERIESAGGRVRRVTGQGFTSFPASIVVSTIDARSTCAKWLEAEPDVSLERLHPPAELFHPSSMLTLRMAVSELNEKPHGLYLFPSSNPFEESRFIDHWRLPPADPGFALAIQTVSPEVEVIGGHHLLTFRVNSAPGTPRFRWTEDRRDELRGILLARVEAAGLKHVATSITEELFVLPQNGRPESRCRSRLRSLPSKVSWQFFPRPPSRIPGTAGLYLAVRGPLDGEGVSPEVLAGMRAAVAASEDA